MLLPEGGTTAGNSRDRVGPLATKVGSRPTFVASGPTIRKQVWGYTSVGE